MKISKYNLYVQLPNTNYLIIHGYSGAVDVIDNRMYSILKENGERNIKKKFSSTELDYLKKRGYLTNLSVTQETKRAIEIGKVFIKTLLSQKKTKADNYMLIPTYDCNLRCFYCYEEKIKKNGNKWIKHKIEQDKIHKAFEVMENRVVDPTRRKNITLYGGEPLLSENKDIINYILNYGRKRGYRFNAVTNAYDLDEYLDCLGNGRIEFLQITLDGDKPVHDRRRIHKNGHGSFEKIVENISKALPTGVAISLRMNIDQNNIEEINNIKNLAHEKGWCEYKTFNMYASNIRYCSPEDYIDQSKIYNFVEKNNLKDYFKAHNQVYHIFKNSFQNKELIYYRVIYCTANTHHLIFDPHGDLYTCWDHVGDEKEKLGVFYPEFIENGTIRERWINAIGINNEKCNKCKYVLFCGGGCAQLKFRSIDNVCKDYGRMFKTAVLAAYKDVFQK